MVKPKLDFSGVIHELASQVPRRHPGDGRAPLPDPVPRWRATDAPRRRRDHRHRHFRADRRGRAEGGPGHDAVVRDRRFRLCRHRVVLRGTRLDGARIRLCLHVFLCGSRRVGRLDRRLGADTRICGRGKRRIGGLVQLFRRGTASPAPHRPADRADQGAVRRWRRQPAGHGHRPGVHVAAGDRNARERQGQCRARHHQDRGTGDLRLPRSTGDPGGQLHAFHAARIPRCRGCRLVDLLCLRRVRRCFNCRRGDARPATQRAVRADRQSRAVHGLLPAGRLGRHRHDRRAAGLWPEPRDPVAGQHRMGCGLQGRYHAAAVLQ